MVVRFQRAGQCCLALFHIVGSIGPGAPSKAQGAWLSPPRFWRWTPWSLRFRPRHRTAKSPRSQQKVPARAIPSTAVDQQSHGPLIPACRIGCAQQSHEGRATQSSEGRTLTGFGLARDLSILSSFLFLPYGMGISILCLFNHCILEAHNMFEFTDSTSLLQSWEKFVARYILTFNRVWFRCCLDEAVDFRLLS